MDFLHRRTADYLQRRGKPLWAGTTTSAGRPKTSLVRARIDRSELHQLLHQTGVCDHTHKPAAESKSTPVSASGEPDLVVYDSLRRDKVPFEPIEPGHVRMYVCGPTVYDLSHVGHARVYTAFDAIVRYLRRRFDVTYVRNFTDVDDKIIKRARETGVSEQQVSEQNIRAFHEDLDALGLQRPDIEPKVTESIPDIIDFVAKLVRRGHAYEVDGDVYFSVGSFDEYGKLGHRSVDQLETEARVDPNDKKRHPMDFALWKAEKPGEISWESPWGRGRPGWHIECSAMNAKHLGETIDIHGGGRDLIFPHHENEVAQSEAAHDCGFARHWMHAGLLQIESQKMSKSLGNFHTIRDVLAEFPAESLRYYLLSGSYRKSLNFSAEGLKATHKRVVYVHETLSRLNRALTPGSSAGPHRHPWVADLVADFEAAMADDFGTGRVIGQAQRALKLVNTILHKPKDPEEDARTLRALREYFDEIGSVIGVFNDDPDAYLQRLEEKNLTAHETKRATIDKLVAARDEARKAGKFEVADALRARLSRLGVELRDEPEATRWFAHRS